MKRIFFLLFLSIMGLSHAQIDSLVGKIPPIQNSKRGFAKFFSELTKIDSSYIEPQHYNFAFMLQNTNTYEMYRLNSKTGQSVVLAPAPSIKVGPYFGWRWIFLGYTFDIRHIHSNNNKQEFNLSIYSPLVGIDLFYKKTGNDYKIKNIDLGRDIKNENFHNIPFDGFKASIKGFNFYYIFNHYKFSYPAAFSQSTVQHRSVGSALIGIGFTKHTLSVDWDKMEDLLQQRITPVAGKQLLDNSLRFGTVEYTDFAVSGGYAYNWVFARNWLFAASLSMGIGYKTSKGDNDLKKGVRQHFSFENMNLDGIGRFGIVWNNTRWYVGANTIFHGYNYKKEQFSTNTIFGTFNIYAGLNFVRKK